MIEDLIAELKNSIVDKKNYQKFAEESKRMWCSCYVENGNYYQLLLHIGNKNVSNVSYTHFETNDIRDTEKNKDEGGRYAAHILIKRDLDEFGTHLILIEKMPGISFSSIAQHLTWVCKTMGFKFKIDGYASKTIGEALKTGFFQNIQVIKREKINADGLDECPTFKETNNICLQVKEGVNEKNKLKKLLIVHLKSTKNLMTRIRKFL